MTVVRTPDEACAAFEARRFSLVIAAPFALADLRRELRIAPDEIDP